MDCSQVVLEISEGRRRRSLDLSPGVLRHLEICPGCRKLVSLAAPVDSPELPEPLLRRLEERISADLQPVQPLASNSWFAALLAASFVALVGFGTYAIRPLAVAKMTAVQVTLALGVLVSTAAVLIVSLTSQVAPGSRHRIPPQWVPWGVLLLLAGVLACQYPYRASPDFWAAGWKCLLTGLAFALPAALFCWLILRRGVILWPRLTTATAGLFAGLAGTAVLELHCPLLDSLHSVTWHVAVSATAAAAGLALAMLLERTDRPRDHQAT